MRGKLRKHWRLPQWLTGRTVLDVGRGNGLGDVLLCTPALRQLKAERPATRIRFYTRYPMLLRGLPYIDEVHRYGDRPEGMLRLRYEDALPENTHFAKLLGRALDIDVVDPRPDCFIDAERIARYQRLWRTLPRPHIVVQRRASRWTPNKDWPDSHWVPLIESLLKSGSVIEIGDTISAGELAHANYVDLRGRTSVEDLAAVVAAADVLVAPPSGPAHIAAAARTPAVVIIGGYEHPANAAYPDQIQFFSDVSCAPCWLREPCPFERKCLTKITPAEVERAVWSLADNIAVASPARD
jgi:ADP-heptose:LPS heptosyltransferase